jgi:hypothetical protein
MVKALKNKALIIQETGGQAADKTLKIMYCPDSTVLLMPKTLTRLMVIDLDNVDFLLGIISSELDCYGN